MRWRVALRLGGAVALTVAVTLSLLQVRVGDGGAAGRSCGSSLDVVTDRAGWESWYRQDRVDEPSPPMLRTLECPAAVNARTVLAAAVGAAGAAAVVATLPAHRPTPAHGVVRTLAARLRRLGRVLTATGSALAAAGVLVLGLLLADGQATMFTYVPRPYAALLGLVVLTPVVALAVGGRALTLLAEAIGERETGHGAT